MKQTILFLLIALFLTFTGCSQNTAADALMKESDAVRDEIVQKIKANPTLAGIDDAQKVLDDKRAVIRQRADALDKADRAQSQSKMFDKIGKDIGVIKDSVVQSLKGKENIDFEKAGEKLDKLTSDYLKTFAIKN